MKRIHLAIGIVMMLAVAATPGAQPSTADRIQRIENGLLPPVIVQGQSPRPLVLENRMRELRVPGVSVAVFEKGRIAWARGWGLADVADGRRVDAGTLFQAGSISKHPVERTLGTANTADYAGFAGIYEVPTRSPPVVLAIEADGGKLYGVVNDMRAELLAENPTTFFATDSDHRIEFVRDASGKVTHARVWQAGIERKALRR